MSFVPLSGPATLHVAEMPRDGVVEFTDERRTVTLPIRAALPVLAKARTQDDAHPSVALLAAASLLAMRFVAAGHFEPVAGSWRLAPLGPDDSDRLRRAKTEIPRSGGAGSRTSRADDAGAAQQSAGKPGAAAAAGD